MSKDLYIYFEGASELQGDSTDTAHKNQIEASSLSHTIFQPKSSSASSAGGHTAERTEHGEILFTKDIDKSTSKLNRACSAGTVYPKCVIYAYRALGGVSSTQTSQSRVLYYTITLDNVVISSVSTSIGAGELPTETVGLKYSKIQWAYIQHKIDGSQVNTGPASWDLAKNIAG